MYLQIVFLVLFLSLSVRGEDVQVKVHISDFTDPFTGFNPFVDLEEGHYDERREWKERRPFQSSDGRVRSRNDDKSEIPQPSFEDRPQDIVDSNAITDTEKSFVFGAIKTEAGKMAHVSRALVFPKTWKNVRGRGSRKCGSQTSRISYESSVTSGATSIHESNKKIEDWLNDIQTRIDIFYKTYVYTVRYFVIGALVIISIFCSKNMHRPVAADLNPNVNNLNDPNVNNRTNQ